MSLKRRFILLIYFLLSFLAIWILGFLVFYQYTPTETCLSSDAEAIVVLTGGRHRIEEAFKLYNQIHARNILISGAGKGVNHNNFGSLMNRYGVPKEELVVGKIAQDTFGNAEEAAIFTSLRGYKSICLVTSEQHILRSVKLFREAMPHIKIYVFPVLSKPLNNSLNKSSISYMQMSFLEYNKLLAAYIICFSNLFSSKYEKLLYTYL